MAAKRPSRWAAGAADPPAVPARGTSDIYGMADVPLVPEGRAGGVVILGRGLARRLEVAVEVAEARKLVPPDEVLFAQTAPAHAATLRACFGSGLPPHR
jgi:hypothetical protein